MLLSRDLSPSWILSVSVSIVLFSQSFSLTHTRSLSHSFPFSLFTLVHCRLALVLLSLTHLFCSRWQSLTLVLLSLRHSFFLSRSLSSGLTCSLSLSLSHTCSLSDSPSPSHSFITHLPRSISLSQTRCLSHSRSLSHALALSLSLYPPHSPFGYIPAFSLSHTRCSLSLSSLSTSSRRYLVVLSHCI